MAQWTKEQIPPLDGKVYIVTGANSGLGYETALVLAEKGATVVMASRNAEKGQRALDDIKVSAPNAKLDLMLLDLASLKAIRAFAQAFKNKYDRLDALINNAGIMAPPRRVTEDGFEAQFGVNHLGHFALTGLLLDVLLKTPASRIVTVSSNMHHGGKIAWDDLTGERAYNPWDAYRQSKLANLLFTFELNRKLEAKGATTVALAAHPGFAATSLSENNLEKVPKFLLRLMNFIMAQSAAMGALPQLLAAVEPQAQAGRYYGPENRSRGYPTEVRANEAAHNEADAKRLWELSAKLTGVTYDALNN